MIDKRMKKIAIALAGAALCLGACQQDGKTEVTLKLKDGQKAPAAIMGVNLTDTLSSERDSLTYYTGAADTLVGVIDLGNNEYWTVVLDGTPVELDFSGETPVLVKGSQTNKLMTEVHLEMSKIEENIKAITDTEYRALAEKYNNDIPDSLMSNLEARYDKAIEDYKAFLTKNIEANKDNVIAAFLLMKSGGMLSVEFEDSFLKNYPYKNLSQFISQFVASQVGGYHLAIRAEEDCGRDRPDVIDFSSLALPTLQVAQLRPCDAQLCGSILPSLQVFVE